MHKGIVCYMMVASFFSNMHYVLGGIEYPAGMGWYPPFRGICHWQMPHSQMCWDEHGIYSVSALIIIDMYVPRESSTAPATSDSWLQRPVRCYNGDTHKVCHHPPVWSY